MRKGLNFGHIIGWILYSNMGNGLIDDYNVVDQSRRPYTQGQCQIQGNNLVWYGGELASGHMKNLACSLDPLFPTLFNYCSLVESSPTRQGHLQS